MLRDVEKLMGYKLAATDGLIGKVKDFLFDDTKWTVRWMVADTGDWLPKRKVLISPVSLGQPVLGSDMIPVGMTKQDIEQAPAISTDEPVSRTHERRLFDAYGWEYYWSGSSIWGGDVMPDSLLTRQTYPTAKDFMPAEKRSDRLSRAIESEVVPVEQDNVLRSAKEVMGYHIELTDGELGHVETMIVDDESWTLRYLVVDTRNWLPGRKVLVTPDWIESVRWADKKVVVELRQTVVEHSPEYDPNVPLTREYETRLYKHYGHTPYWKA